MIRYIETNPSAVAACLRIVVDDLLVGEWGAGWFLDDVRWGKFYLTSTNRYNQMVFALETSHNILESDPGPLDAKVS